MDGFWIRSFPIGGPPVPFQGGELLLTPENERLEAENHLFEKEDLPNLSFGLPC